MKTKFKLSRRDLPEQINMTDLINEINKDKESLQHIHLHHFHDEEVEILLTAMHACSSLREIDLSENMLEDVQVPLLIQLLNHLPTIERLNVSHSFLSERGIEMLSTTCTLKKISLDISFSRMSHERTMFYQKNFTIPPLKLRVNSRTDKLNMPISAEKLITSIPNYQQDFTYDCGATTILNIHEYFNKILQKKASVPTLKELVTSIKTCDMVGAEIENMMAWFEYHHYEVVGGFGGNEEMLRHYTGLGIPVIINTNEWGGHYIVIIGFEEFDPIWPGKDKLWCCDPLDYQNGDFAVNKPYSKRNLFPFLDQWRDSKGRAGGYIAALPSEIARLVPDWKFNLM